MYDAAKGHRSWRHQNEKRVRHALNLLLFGPPAVPSGFGSWLESLAYDRNAALAPGLLERVTLAAVNYHLLFPGDRWTKNKSNKSVDGCPIGFKWNEKPTGGVSEDAKTAMAVVVGSVPAPYIDYMVRRGGVDLSPPLSIPGQPAAVEDPPVVRAFRDRWKVVAATVPGSSPLEAVDTLPTVESLVTVANGLVQPTPWLASFLDVFAPAAIGGRITMASSALRIRGASTTGGRLDVSASSLRKIRPLISHDEMVNEEDAPAGLSTGAKVALGLAVVGLVAGAVVLVRRRR